MKVREARASDLGALLDLYSLLAEPGVGSWSRPADDLFTRVLLDPNQKTLVAEVYAEVVGTLVLAVLPNLAHGGASYAIIENVVVDEEHRGMSVGDALVREALRRAREAGAYKVSLCSGAARVGAHEFYRAMGFEESHVGFEVRS